MQGKDVDLDESCREVGTDQLGEVVEEEHADRMVVGVDHVLVGDAVLTCAGQDDGIRGIKLAGRSRARWNQPSWCPLWDSNPEPTD